MQCSETVKKKKHTSWRFSACWIKHFASKLMKAKKAFSQLLINGVISCCLDTSISNTWVSLVESVPIPDSQSLGDSCQNCKLEIDCNTWKAGNSPISPQGVKTKWNKKGGGAARINRRHQVYVECRWQISQVSVYNVQNCFLGDRACQAGLLKSFLLPFESIS